MAWYQIYIVASASLVGMMSVGTSYLAFSGRWARTYGAVIGLLMMGVGGATMGSPPQDHGRKDGRRFNAGAGIGGMTRLVYILLSAIGGSGVWWAHCGHTGAVVFFTIWGILVAGLAGTLAPPGAWYRGISFGEHCSIAPHFLGPREITSITVAATPTMSVLS